MSHGNAEKLRIAAFGGFRTIPPRAGSAGADKFAFELYPRLVAKGHQLTAYTRIYPQDRDAPADSYQGIRLLPFRTVSRAGLDTLLHSFKVTADIIFHNRADVVHIMSGANSIWSVFLRLAGKKVVLSQFAMDWKRDKWPWYGKLFYIMSNYLTAYFPHRVVFDNIYTKDYFEKKFGKPFDFVPYGCEVNESGDASGILQKLGLSAGEYFLFVGRFIPDKGVHLLTEAFSHIKTDKKLVIVGGSPNPSNYEMQLKQVSDPRIMFPGYIYGGDTNALMKNAFAYVQPSIIEGLSPVLLTVMGLGTPVVCSDIVENIYITNDNAVHFGTGDAAALAEKLEFALSHVDELATKAAAGKADVENRFSWEKITNEFIEIFSR